MRKLTILPLLITLSACSSLEWMPGYWNVSEAIRQCEKERLKVNYPAECDSSTAKNVAINGYGEVWLVNTSTDKIRKIWKIK